MNPVANNKEGRFGILERLVAGQRKVQYIEDRHDDGQAMDEAVDEFETASPFARGAIIDVSGQVEVGMEAPADAEMRIVGRMRCGRICPGVDEGGELHIVDQGGHVVLCAVGTEENLRVRGEASVVERCDEVCERQATVPQCGAGEGPGACRVRYTPIENVCGVKMQVSRKYRAAAAIGDRSGDGYGTR